MKPLTYTPWKSLDIEPEHDGMYQVRFNDQSVAWSKFKRSDVMKRNGSMLNINGWGAVYYRTNRTETKQTYLSRTVLAPVELL